MSFVNMFSLDFREFSTKHVSKTPILCLFCLFFTIQPCDNSLCILLQPYLCSNKFLLHEFSGI